MSPASVGDIKGMGLYGRRRHSGMMFGDISWPHAPAGVQRIGGSTLQPCITAGKIDPDATFRPTARCLAERGAMQHKSVSNEAADTAPAPCVLLVEDEFLIRLVVADHLRETGFAVVEAMTGDEAIDILAAGASIDLVFTDVRMPGKADGLELLAFIKRTRPDLPVVMTSGHLEARVALASGAASFLPKPCDLELIALTLRAAGRR